MDTELKNKWVAALRSGEYKQARGRLQRGDSYCCLGVLCKVAGMEIHPSEDTISPKGDLNYYGYIKIWDLIGGAEFGRKLAELNDLGTSFDKIADTIESQFPTMEERK